MSSGYYSTCQLLAVYSGDTSTGLTMYNVHQFDYQSKLQNNFGYHSDIPDETGDSAVPDHYGRHSDQRSETFSYA